MKELIKEELKRFWTDEYYADSEKIAELIIETNLAAVRYAANPVEAAKEDGDNDYLRAVYPEIRDRIFSPKVTGKGKSSQSRKPKTLPIFNDPRFRLLCACTDSNRIKTILAREYPGRRKRIRGWPTPNSIAAVIWGFSVDELERKRVKRSRLGGRFAER